MGISDAILRYYCFQITIMIEYHQITIDDDATVLCKCIIGNYLYLEV